MSKGKDQMECPACHGRLIGDGHPLFCPKAVSPEVFRQANMRELRKFWAEIEDESEDESED